jgi:RimJ/RimL family protein N-acetyltransferase
MIALPLPESPVFPDPPDLQLRRHRTSDIDAIAEQCRDDEMQRWTTVPVPYTRSDAEGFVAQVRQAWTDGSAAALAIELDGNFAGSINLDFRDGAWSEIGFGLAPWARGRHVMRRAVRIMLAWGFGELNLAGVEWRAHVGNHASWRVAEACGFQLEGTVRGLLVQRGLRVDGWIGTVLADEYAA